MKKEILSKIGHIEQLAYARNIVFQDGRAKGLQAILVKCGDISFVVAKDKCLDILELTYKGKMINFLSKAGFLGQTSFDTNGAEAQRSIMGGLFFTCGLSNVGPPETNLAMHGRIRTTPAENISVKCDFCDDDYVIEVSGTMRQSQLFSENLVLRRTISVSLIKQEIEIFDQIENQSFKDEPCMILYHFNIGYPLLGEKSKFITNSIGIVPRDSVSDVEKAMIFTQPVDNKEEEVFYHTLSTEKSFASIENQDTRFTLSFNKSQLPFLTEWKSMASGDYVLGIEPGNCHVQGQTFERDNGTLEYIKPFEKKDISLKIKLESI